MLDPRLVLLGALFSLAGSARYAWQTFRGRTRPNRVSWFLWACAPLVGLLAQLDEGVGWPAVLTLSIALGPAVIFTASFLSPGAYWRIRRFDVACGAVAVVALVVWLGLDDPALAVGFAVLADLVAGVPTIRKTWTAPSSESPAAYVGGGANGILTLLTLDPFDVATAAFPLYLALLGTGLCAILVLGRGVAAAR